MVVSSCGCLDFPIMKSLLRSFVFFSNLVILICFYWIFDFWIWIFYSSSFILVSLSFSAFSLSLIFLCLSRSFISFILKEINCRLISSFTDGLYSGSMLIILLTSPCNSSLYFNGSLGNLPAFILIARARWLLA